MSDLGPQSSISRLFSLRKGRKSMEVDVPVLQQAKLERKESDLISLINLCFFILFNRLLHFFVFL
jgi:hypothetical protein